MFHNNNNNNNNNIYQIRHNNNGIQSSPSTTSFSSASPSSSSSPLMRGNMNTTNNNTNNNSTNSTNNNSNSFLSKIANSINAKKQQQQQQQQQQQVPRSPSATTTTTTSNTIASTSSPISIKTNHAVNINISSPLQTNNINTNTSNININHNNNNNNGSGSSVPVSITQTKKSTLAPTKLVLSSSLSPPHQSHNHQHHNGWKKTNGSSLSSSNMTASALNRRKSHSSSLIQSFYSEIESTLSSSLSSDDASSFNNSYYSSSFSSSSLPSTAVSTHNNTQYGADRVGAVAAGDCFETECLANILSSSSSFSSSAAGNYRSLSAMHHQHQQQKQQEPQRKQQQLPQQRRDKSTSSEGCDADVNNDDDDDEDEDHHSNAIKVKKYTKKRRKTIATFKIDAFSDSDDDDEDDDNEDDEDEDDNNSDDDHDENKNDSSSASSNGASRDKTKTETKNRTSRSFSTGTTSAGRKWFSKQFVSSGEEDSEASDRSHNSVDQDDDDSTGATVSSSTTPTFNATISSLVTRRPSSQEPLGNSDNSDDASSASAPINVDNVDKKEVLLLFLLQHVCRQFTPDPTYFKSMCTQLLEYGYLSDSRYLDHNFLKSVCKDFMLDVISNWPAFSEAAPQGEITEGGAASKSKLRRSESVGSFLSGLGRDMEMSRRGNPLVSSTELPFFDFMFYSTSRFKQDWGSKAKLGKGAFGSVFRSRHRIDGHEYAIKRIKFCFRNKLELEQTYAKVIREVKLLASLDHPNIVRYNQAWFEPSWKDPDYGEQENNDDEEDDFDSEKVDDFESNINDGSTVNSGSSGFANIGVDANIKRTNDDCANNVQFSFDEEADPASPFTPSMPLNSDNVKFECSSDDDSVISLVQLPEEPHPYDKYQSSFIAPSPQDMSYLEYAIKQKQQGTATRQPIVPHRSITEKVTNSPAVVDNSVQQAVKNLLAEMFNEKKNKFEMFLFIQMQLCQQNTLEDYMWNQNRVQQCVVDYGQCMNFFKQIAEGVAYIHSKELMHRDLKPKNIFITNDNIIKIGDFGLAKSVRDNLVHTKSNKHGTEHGDKQIVQRSQSPIGSDLSDHTSGVGTYFYASPEQYATSMYDDKADVFSLGVILFEMLHPFATKSERAHILTGLRSGKIPDSKQEKYPEEMELVKRCIDSAPMSRPTAREVLTITKGILLRKQKRNVNGQKSYAHLDSSVNSTHIAQTNDEVVTTKPVTNDLDVRMLLQQKDDEIMQLRAELERLRRNQK